MTLPDSFKQQWMDFLKFVVHPNAKRGVGRGQGSSWQADWTVSLSVKRLFQWAGMMWLVNLVILAPIAAVVSRYLGADHKITHFSFMLAIMAVVLAPLMEELLFRFWLRQPKWGWIGILPGVLSIVLGLHVITLLALLICFIALVFYIPRLSQAPISFKFWRGYARYYPWIVHGSVFLFALLHLFNYVYPKTWGNAWAIVFLILPQWFSGLVLAYMRTRYGIAHSMVLHGIFNAGPVLVMFLFWLVDPTGTFPV